MFVRDTAPFRRKLLAHCYRMLGSVDDAEDVVQETYLRAWRSYGTFEGRSSVRTWRVIVLTVTSAGISHNVSFGDPALLPKFGFPMVLPT